MFKVFVHDGSEKLPDDNIMYVVAKEGIYLRKNLGIVDSLVPVRGISILESLSSYARLKIPKIPRNMFAKVVSLFRRVYHDHRSECVALIFYNEKKKKYKLQIPFQKVSPGAADYLKTSPFKNFNLICTVHSHMGGASHSTIDDHDEANFDGLHITLGNLGNLGQEMFDISVTVVVNGMRFIVKPETYIEGLSKTQYCNYFAHMFRPKPKKDKDGSIKYNDAKVYSAYSLDVPTNHVHDPAWMNFIERQYGMGGAVHVQRQYNYFQPDLRKVDHEEDVIFNPCDSCPFKGWRQTSKHDRKKPLGTEPISRFIYGVTDKD